MQLDLASLEIYGYSDLAAGKDARTRSKHRTARQVIVIGARDWLMRWFWLYIWAGRETASQFKERIIAAQETWNPRRFGLEANGMQVLFGSLVREEAEHRLGNIKMFAVYQSTKVDKNYRIRTGIEPVILQGRFFLAGKEVEARAEIAGFPTAQTKDIVDAMESCMNQVAPKRVVKASEDHERDAYAAYLRASGMRASLIERSMGEYMRRRSIM